MFGLTLKAVRATGTLLLGWGRNAGKGDFIIKRALFCKDRYF